MFGDFFLYIIQCLWVFKFNKLMFNCKVNAFFLFNKQTYSYCSIMFLTWLTTCYWLHKFSLLNMIENKQKKICKLKIYKIYLIDLVLSNIFKAKL